MHSIFCKLIISFMHQVIGFIPPIPNQPVQIETFVFKCATLPDPLYLQVDVIQSPFMGEVKKQVLKELEQLYDFKYPQTQVEVKLMKDGKILSLDEAVQGPKKGLQNPYHLVFKKPEHLHEQQLKAGPHMPYQLQYNPLLYHHGMSELPQQGQIKASQLHEAICNFEPDLIKQIIDGNQLLSQMCEANPELSQIWDKPQEFGQIMSLQGIKKSLNELGIGKPLTEQQKKQKQQIREQLQKKAKLLGIKLIDFSQFPGYLESKKRNQVKHGFGTSFFNDPVLDQLLSIMHRDPFHRKSQEEKRREEEQEMRRREEDMQAPDTVSWRTFLISQQGMDNPKKKFEVQLVKMQERGFKDEEQNIYGLSRAFVHNRTREQNLNNAEKKIHEYRQKKVEWKERQKLPPEERRKVQEEMLRRGQAVFDFTKQEQRAAEKRRQLQKQGKMIDEREFAKMPTEGQKQETEGKMIDEKEHVKLPKQEKERERETQKNKFKKKEKEEKMVDEKEWVKMPKQEEKK